MITQNGKVVLCRPHCSAIPFISIFFNFEKVREVQMNTKPTYLYL